MSSATLLGILLTFVIALLLLCGSLIAVCSSNTKTQNRVVSFLGLAMMLGGGLSISILSYILLYQEPLLFELGSLYKFKHHSLDFGYRIEIPSSVFLVVIFFFGGLAGHFSNRYLLRESGRTKFFVWYCLFIFGLVVAAVASTLDFTFVGWELVGLSSVFLIMFYDSRSGPVQNSIVAWTSYRFSDACFIILIAFSHFQLGGSRFETLFSSPGTHIDKLAILVLLASLAKGAQFPLGAWLPRAMEGPTSSSAIFYGALSVHLGPLLILRSYDFFSLSKSVLMGTVAVGAMTVISGVIHGRSRSDVKTRLAYATNVQVGLIYIELGFGYPSLAIVHLAANASLRTIQFLKAPSAIHFAHSGKGVRQSDWSLESLLPIYVQHLLYRFALSNEIRTGGWTTAVIQAVSEASRFVWKWGMGNAELSERGANEVLGKKE